MRLRPLQRLFTFLSILILAVILFSGCSTFSKSTANTGESKSKKIYTDIITVPDITSLVKESKFIISGNVISVDSTVKVQTKFSFPDTVSQAERDKLQNSEEGYHMYTVSEVEVTKVIKGDLKEGDVIKLYQLGGSSKEKTEFVDEFDYYKQGDKRIFFISEWDGKNSTVNPIQGDIRIVGKKSSVHRENKLFKNGISEDNLIRTIKTYTGNGK